MDREAWRLTLDLLAAVDPDADLRVAALALIGAGIMLLAESDPETAHRLADVRESGALRR